MQLAVAKYMAEISPPPAAFVVDCLPDMDAAMVTSRTVPLVRLTLTLTLTLALALTLPLTLSLSLT